MNGKKRPKRKLRKGFIGAMLSVIMVVFIILLATVLLPINNISVKYSGKKYTSKEILALSGINKGDNIIMTLESVVNKKVTEGLPFIGSVEIVKEMPDTVTLVVSETKAAYCVKHKKKYISMDSGFKILETTEKRNKKLTYISGLKLSEAEEGRIAAFKDANAFNNAKEIMETVKKSGNSVNYLDATSQFDIRLTVNGKYAVEIGTTADLTEKLNFMNKMIEQIEKKHNNDKGTINLRYYTEKKEGYFTRGEKNETYN